MAVFTNKNEIIVKFRFMIIKWDFIYIYFWADKTLIIQIIKVKFKFISYFLDLIHFLLNLQKIFFLLTLIHSRLLKNLFKIISQLFITCDFARNHWFTFIAQLHVIEIFILQFKLSQLQVWNQSKISVENNLISMLIVWSNIFTLFL